MLLRQRLRAEGSIALKVVTSEFFKEIKKSTKVSKSCTDILSVTTKNVVIFPNYQLS